MAAEPPCATPAARLVADLPSNSFALVMATGIVSLAAAMLGFAKLALLLLAVNAVAFIALWALTLLRLAYCAPAMSADLRDHRRGVGFLTIVAGTNVLAEQLAVLAGRRDAAAVLWVGASALWVALAYAFLLGAATRVAKPRLAQGIDGGWLLLVVAPQSSAILGVQIAGVFPAPEIVVFASLALYLLGSALYVILITLIVYRWLFRPMAPDEFGPSYWINMGAAAITTLAGAHLATAVAADPMLAGLHGYILGETALFWAVASWWIPLLAAITGWRHWSGGVPLTYRSDYWAMVFPLGMYTAATDALSRALGAGFLTAVPRAFFWIALTAWCVTFFGMVRYLLGRRLVERRRTP